MRAAPFLLCVSLVSTAAAAPPPPEDAGEPTVLAASGEQVRKSLGALTAWDGAAWRKVLESSCPKRLRCYAKELDQQPCMKLAGGVKPLEGKVDVDGDGGDDVLVDVPCEDADDDMCGTLVLVRAGECLRATGFVSGQKVSIHKPGKPAELLVSTEDPESTTWSETVMVKKGGGWRPTLTRDCDRKKGCGKQFPEAKRKGG